MKGLKVICWIVILIMIIYGSRILMEDSLGHGAGFDVFLAGSASPWQAFINQDLTSGLLIVLFWIIYRQKGERAIDTFAWAWMLLWWGNIVTAAYVLIAIRQSEGDPARLFAGRRAGSLTPVWNRPALPVQALFVVLALAILAYMTVLLQQARDAVSIIGAIAGLAPVALSLILLAFPQSEGKPVAALQ